MKKNFLLSFYTFLILILSILLVSCGSGSGAGDTNTSSGVDIRQASLQVSMLSPEGNSRNVQVLPTIQLTFSAAVSNVNSSTVKLREGGFNGNAVEISEVSEDANHIYSFKPRIDLREDTLYFVVVTDGVKRVSNNSAIEEAAFYFTTAAAQ